MKVQRVRLSDTGRPSWIVLDDAFLPDEPVNRFLRYLTALDRSPNTVRTYAYHLRLFREFTATRRLDWATVDIDDLADFVDWLRHTPPATATAPVPLVPPEPGPGRAKRTIYAILGAVHEFYTYHAAHQTGPDRPLYRFVTLPQRRYKDFLYHVTKRRPVEARLVAVPRPEPERALPKTLSPEQVRRLLAACRHQRDRFLVALLYESGMRIGQALGLRHADVRSWDNEIDIVPRDDNANGARAKARERYTVVVPMRVMQLYTAYVTEELLPLLEEHGVLSDYVFVNLWEGQIGRPLAYPTVRALLQRLSRRASDAAGEPVVARPHQLRHTYATERIRAGVPLAVVQRQLGHLSIATTTQTYTHLTAADLKAGLGLGPAGDATPSAPPGGGG